MCLQTTKPPARTRRMRTPPGATTLAEDEQRGSADSSYSSAADRRRSVSSRCRTRTASPGSGRARRTFQELTEVSHSWCTSGLSFQGPCEVPNSDKAFSALSAAYRGEPFSLHFSFSSQAGAPNSMAAQCSPGQLAGTSPLHSCQCAFQWCWAAAEGPSGTPLCCAAG